MAERKRDDAFRWSSEKEEWTASIMQSALVAMIDSYYLLILLSWCFMAVGILSVALLPPSVNFLVPPCPASLITFEPVQMREW